MQLDADKFLACVMVTGLITAAGCGRSNQEPAQARQTDTGGESAATAPPPSGEVEQYPMEDQTPEPGYGVPPARNLPESGLGQEEPAPITE
jgi:hypothetical protein